MPKKSIQRIPKSVILICPHCHKGTTAKVSIDASPQKYNCPKCKQEVRTPITRCCVICAYSNSGTELFGFQDTFKLTSERADNEQECPRELYMKARVKGWEIR